MISVIVGSFGYGKTTYLKNTFLNKSRKEKLIYALIGQDFNEHKTIRNFKIFVDDAVKMSDTIFVVDEAKTALPQKEPDANKNPFERNLLTWFLNARKCNNNIFIVYHTLRQVPVWLIGYIDYLVRFGTTEQRKYMLNRFDGIEPIIASLKKYPTIKKFDKDVIKITNRKE